MGNLDQEVKAELAKGQRQEKEKLAEEIHKALYYYKLLVSHGLTMTGMTRAEAKKHKFPKLSKKQAESEAHNLGLRGWIYQLFVMEARQGNVEPSQMENVTEQGFLDNIITPLTLGLIHGPGAGGTKHNVNPKTGVVKNENEPGVGESVQKGTSEGLDFIGKLLSNEGLRLLEIIGGAALVLFGMYVLVKGEPPTVSTVTKHVV